MAADIIFALDGCLNAFAAWHPNWPDFRIHIYEEIASPTTKDAQIADFTEATFDGADAQTIGAVSPIFLNDGDLHQFDTDTFVWTLEEDLVAPLNIKGWFITNATDTEVICHAHFDPMRTIQFIGDTVFAQPGITIDSLFPTP